MSVPVVITLIITASYTVRHGSTHVVRQDVLEVRDLSLELGGTRVLRSLSFNVGRGEVLAVVGPNGAGKTSLLETMVGLRRESSGSVAFAGIELTDLRSLASTFAYTPDEIAPYVELRASDIMAHADATSGKCDPQLRRDLGVDAVGGALMGTLSRGERKRVALYVALSTTRPITVLDEPLGVFDPLSLRDVIATFRRRASDGLSMLLTVHQLRDAEKIADRVLLLSSGRAVALGTVTELRAKFGLPPGASLEDIFEHALGAADAAP